MSESQTPHEQANKIVQFTVEWFGTTTARLKGKRKFEQLSEARHFVVYFLRHYLGFRFNQIKPYVGYKDHASAIYGVNKIKKRLARSDERAVHYRDKLIAHMGEGFKEVRVATKPARHGHYSSDKEDEDRRRVEAFKQGRLKD